MIWIFLYIFISLLFYLLRGYLSIRKTLQYWKERNVPHILPRLLFFLNLKYPTNKHLYEEFKGKGPFGGFYNATIPSVFVTDLDLVKNILVKNFDHFEDRIAYGKPNYGLAFGGIFFRKGQEWRTHRRKTSPMYTSKNLKMFHETLVNVTEKFLKNMEKSLQSDKEIDGSVVMQEYLFETCGTTFFGSSFETVKQQTYFKKLVQEMLKIVDRTVKFVSYAVFLPNVCNYLRMKITKVEIKEIFLNHLHESLEVRKNNNDDEVNLIGLCLNVLDKEQSESSTFQEIANQLFFFYFAEFGVVRVNLILALYELAVNQEIQNRARQETKKYIEKFNGKCTYDACMEMKYVNQIILEIMRKYPTVQSLLRICTKSYQVPGTNYKIEKGTPVVISIEAIHHDPEIYPEPNTFDPDRFTKDAIDARHSHAWLGFGAGPRMCIAMRLGLMQLRISLASFLSNYQISLSPKMDTASVPTDIVDKLDYLTKDGNLWFTFEKI